MVNPVYGKVARVSFVSFFNSFFFSFFRKLRLVPIRNERETVPRPRISRNRGIDFSRTTLPFREKLTVKIRCAYSTERENH